MSCFPCHFLQNTKFRSLLTSFDQILNSQLIITVGENWHQDKLLYLILQSILKEISPGISLEGMMLKLKLQYFGHLMRRVDSLEKTLMLGGIGVRRRRGWQRMRCLDSITDSMDVSLSELRELVMEIGRASCRERVYYVV